MLKVLLTFSLFSLTVNYIKKYWEGWSYIRFRKYGMGHFILLSGLFEKLMDRYLIFWISLFCEEAFLTLGTDLCYHELLGCFTNLCKS